MLQLKEILKKSNTNVESNSKEETYNYEDSVTQHLYVDINKKGYKN